MEVEATSFERTHRACQVNGNRINSPAIELQSLSTPRPFHTLVFDLIGRINPPSKGYIWILATTKYYTKWVEAIALRRASEVTVSNLEF